MSKGSSTSPFEKSAVNQASGFIAHIKLGLHKNADDWRTKLQAAKSQWEKPDHDRAILGIASMKDIHQDEVEAAKKWECFRHLYFSKELSVFWKKLIEGNRFDALETYKSSLHRGSFLGDRPDSFGAPWNAWAENPCFPSMTWHEAKQHPEFSSALYSSPRPAPAVRLLQDDVRAWALLHGQSKAEVQKMHDLLEADPKAFNERQMEGMHRPMEIQPHQKATTVLAVEINWNASKGEILNAFWEQISPIWESRPRQVRGPRIRIDPFLKGLVMLRRKSRGDSTEIYKPLPDGGPTKAAKDALREAQDKLADTKAELDRIESDFRKM